MATFPPDTPARKRKSLGILSGWRGRQHREALQAYIYLLPAAIILTAFHFWPVIYAFYISLHKWRIRPTGATCWEVFTTRLFGGDLQGTIDCVGLLNYQRALGLGEFAGGPAADRFWNSIQVTIWYVIGTVPIQLALGLIIAFLLFQRIKGKEGLRMVYFLPYVTSTVAAGAVFAKMFNPGHGPVNGFLAAIGLQPLRWMKEPRGIFEVLGETLGLSSVPIAGPSIALVTIMFFVIWFWVGYNATIFLAGLGNIPYELYEAARIDGASRRQLFQYITLPLLSPTTFFLSLVAVIGSFQAFNHVFIMAEASATDIGGPLGTTTTAAILIYNNAFGTPTFGYAAAMSFLLFILILIVSLLQNRIAGRHVHYT